MNLPIASNKLLPADKTMQARLPLRTGKEWREIPPRATQWKLAWESRSRIFVSHTDFRKVMDLGSTGEMESALSHDPEGGFLYRFRSSLHALGSAYNEITAMNPLSGEKKSFFSIHPLRWIPWFLHKLCDKPILIGLVVTDASRPEKPGVELLHQIGLFHLKENRSVYRPLPAGCQFPLGLDHAKERILFSGPDGFQLVNLKGKRILRLPPGENWEARGGVGFHPKDGSFLLSGNGIHLCRPAEGGLRKIHSEGIHPTWSPDGEWIYFLKHSGELHRLHPESGTLEFILSTIQCRHPEIKMARPPVFSPDGQYAALPITRRAPLDTTHLKAGQATWSEHQTLVVLDLNQKMFWQHPGPVLQACWAGKSAA